MVTPKHDAFLKAYKGCHEPFVRYCSALAFGKMDAEDLVQDVLLSAFQHFDKVKNKDQFLHYLIRAAKNKSISNWRKKKYVGEFIEKHAERLTAKEVAADTLLDIQLLYRTIDQLPEKQRDAIILFEISGFSMKEIAEIQNSTEGAIKTKVSRGRQLLKKLLHEDTRQISAILKTIQSISL